MAAEMVAGAALGTALGIAWEAFKIAAGKAATSAATNSLFRFDKIYSNLVEDLEIYHPYFEEIFHNIDESAPREWEEDALRFKETLQKGIQLLDQHHSQLQQLRGLSGIFHPRQRHRLGKEIQRLTEAIQKFMKENRLPILGSLQVMERIRELEERLVAKADEQRNAIIEEMISRLTISNSDEAGSSQDAAAVTSRAASTSNAPPLPMGMMAVEDHIQRLKSSVMGENSKKMVAIVGGMGGIGKTTLASAFGRDPEVIKFFGGGIHFVTVSQKPNMVALLSTIWSDVTRDHNKPPFRDAEDAYHRLHSRLEYYMQTSLPSSNVLLVLDDVWSEENLEKLNFYGIPRFWTLVTTRHAQKLKTVQQTPLVYELNLLRKEDARRLFCRWAFNGEEDIPPWVPDRELVEEVIIECKGLPLALKVIGASLAAKAQHITAWSRTRDKLRQAADLEHEPEEKLFGRIGTSVDVLESQLHRDCFMDLGAFPEDTWSPVDNLLDIWVYVRGMTWEAAYFTLLEFQFRCLLNVRDPSSDRHRYIDTIAKSIDRYTDSDHEYITNLTEYGCGGCLEFYQHDVLRDLAIHRGRKDEQRRWLLMPQPQPNVPQEWKSEGLANTVQVISVNLSDSAKYSPSLQLHFPRAKVLLLYMAQVDPASLIKNMSELKVLVIKTNGYVAFRGSGGRRLQLQGLRCLQSLYVDAVGAIKFDDLSWWSTSPKLKKLIIRNYDRLERFERQGNMRISYNMLVKKLSSSLEILLLPRVTYDRKVNVNGITKQVFQNLKVLYIDSYFDRKILNRVLQAKALVVLALDLHYHSSDNFPNEIGELPQLKQLHLLGRKASIAAELEGIIEGLGHHQQLEALELISCDFPLPRNIGQLQCLKTLRLYGFDLAVDVLPESLVNLRRLQILELRGFDDLKELPDGIWQLACLRELILQKTPLLRGLPESIVKLTSLKALILIQCRSLTHLPPAIEQLPCLKRTDI